MKSILIIQRRLTHYRVAFFEQLRKELRARGIALRVAYGAPHASEVSKRDSGSLSWAEPVRARYWLGERLCWISPPTDMRDADMVVVTPENKMLSNLPIQYCFLSQRVALWGHGANLQGNPSSLRERFKRIVAKRADWWFGYTRMSLPLIERSGFAPERITVLDNSVDTNTLQREVLSVGVEAQTELLGRLGLKGKRVGVFIGSLYAEKRIEFLLSAAEEVHRRVPDFELLIAGSGAELPLIEKFCVDNSWARYVGMVKGEAKACVLSIARVMLNPGLVGLGILDSFVAQAPIVTTDCGLHSPEVAYLESGSNGLMCEDTEEDFVTSVCKILLDDGLWSRLREGCGVSARQYTIENMARNFADGVERCLSAPILRGSR